MSIRVIFILLLPCISASFLERDLLQSVERAMRCTHREPPREPVIALSPKKYSQLIALMRKNLDTPFCNKNRPISVFDIEDTETWNFCVVGICEYSECHCNRPYIGHTCAIYNGKCWMMYCFLSGCHPEHQSLTCKCDPQLYGTRVLTGDYWYDDGKRSTFHYPPSGWIDDFIVSPTNIAYKKGKSSGRVKFLGEQDPYGYSPIVVGSIDIHGNIKGDMGQNKLRKTLQDGGKVKKFQSGRQYLGQNSGSMAKNNMDYDVPVVVESFDRFGNRIRGKDQSERRTNFQNVAKGKKFQSGKQHNGENSGSMAEKDQDYDVPVVVESFDRFGIPIRNLGVTKAPQDIESSKKYPNGRLKPQEGDFRNNLHLNRPESISENGGMFQRGPSQRLPVREPGNEDAVLQNYKNAVKPDRVEEQRDDTTEDLKEALEEVEMENSSVIDERKWFYLVTFLNFIIIFGVFY